MTMPSDRRVQCAGSGARRAAARTVRADGRPGRDDEHGSLVTEYGLVTVVGATVAGLMLRWASGGAVTELLGAVLGRVRELVGV